MKKHLLPVLDLLLDSLGYILIVYLLSSAALSFRTSFLSVLFRTARMAFLGLYFNSLQKKMKNKFLPYLFVILCFLANAALMYGFGYLQMTLTPLSR